MLSSLDVGLIFPTASVLGLYSPNVTCLCCHQCLFGFFQLENIPQGKLFILLKRRHLNRSFLHPYDTFNLATLEIRSVGAACPGYCGRGLQRFTSSIWDPSGPAVWRPSPLLEIGCCEGGRWACRGLPVHGMAIPWCGVGVRHLGKKLFDFVCLQESSKFMLLGLLICSWVLMYHKVAGYTHLLY